MFLRIIYWVYPKKRNESRIKYEFTKNKFGDILWQRSYHDHIIRGEEDYQKIWKYIDTNEIKWETDCFYNKKDM